jgi:uncharacterized membrane-anchored protein
MKLKLMLLAGVLTLQTAWMLGTALIHETSLFEGTPITLETRPVDPRDLLRGDFVILNYKISNLPLTLFSVPPPSGFSPGQRVYVALEPRGEFYDAVSASTNKFALGPGQIMLHGKVQTRWNGPGSSNVRIEYGLERFYVREGTGNPQGKLTVQVAVSSSGKGSIKEVFVDGVPYAQAMGSHER